MPAFLLLFLTLPDAASGRSWHDLDEGESEIYGREREEKLPLRLFVIQREKWEGHDALHIFWLFGYKDYPRYSSRRILPFYYRLESTIDNRRLTLTPLGFAETDGESESSIWFWLFFRGKDLAKKESYSGLFPLYYREQTGETALSYWLTPLFWYSTTTAPGGSYSFGAPIVPLVMLAREGNETDVMLFYIFGYRGGAQTRSYLLPLWYYERQKQGYLLSIAPPLAWYASNDTRSWLLIFPLWYSSHDAQGTTVASPLYIHSETPVSRLSAFIPLWLSYSYKDYQLHINAAGISLSEEQFSALPVSLGLSGNQLYADGDFGWFYSLFRVSTRSSLGHGDAATDDENPPLQDTGITVRRQRNRADSAAFFGLYAIFGALAYEQADHYRHFRLLPLSWLTWDTRADSGVQTVIPFYVHYRDAESHYLVIAPLLAPLYAYQQTTQSRLFETTGEVTPVTSPPKPKLQAATACRSNKAAWLLILLIREYDCVLDETEHTLLWPVFNRYASAERGGYRIFPLLWSKRQRQDAGEARWHFSPLHYSHSLADSSRLLTWLFYYRGSEKAWSYGTWGIWHIGHSEQSSITYVFPVWLRTGTTAANAGRGVTGRREALLTIAGIWWRYSFAVDAQPPHAAHFSPLYLCFQSGDELDFYSWLYYHSHRVGLRRSGIPLVFNRTVRGHTYENFYLFPFYRSSERLSTGETEHLSWFFPVWYARSDGNSAERFLAGYWYERRPGFALDNVLLLAGRSDEETSDRHSRHALLYAFRYEAAPAESSLNLLYGLLFSRESTAAQFSWHFALITGYRATADGIYRRHHLLPAYWSSVQPDERMLILPALLSVFTSSHDGNRQFQAVLAGLLWYNDNDAAEYRQTEAIGAGIVWFHSRKAERRFDSYGSLFGLLWHYETEANYRRLAILTFLYTRTETENGVRHRLLGVPL